MTEFESAPIHAHAQSAVKDTTANAFIKVKMLLMGGIFRLRSWLKVSTALTSSGAKPCSRRW
jgi:hypothetical protein